MFVQSLTHAFIGHLFSVSNTILGIGKAEKVECGPCLAEVHRRDWEQRGTSDRSDVIPALRDWNVLMWIHTISLRG